MNRIKHSLIFAYDTLARFERVVLFSTSLCLVFTISVVVFMRYVLKTDLFAYDELVMIVAWWMYFIGAAHGSREDSQIKADILQVYFSVKKPRVAWLLNIIARGLEVVFVFAITFWSWSLIMWQLKFAGKTVAWGIPLIVPQSAIFLGFSLMSLYAVVHFVKAFSPLRAKPLHDSFV